MLVEWVHRKLFKQSVEPMVRIHCRSSFRVTVSSAPMVRSWDIHAGLRQRNFCCAWKVQLFYSRAFQGIIHNRSWQQGDRLCESSTFSGVRRSYVISVDFHLSFCNEYSLLYDSSVVRRISVPGGDNYQCIFLSNSISKMRSIIQDRSASNSF